MQWNENDHRFCVVLPRVVLLSSEEDAGSHAVSVSFTNNFCKTRTVKQGSGRTLQYDK